MNRLSTTFCLILFLMLSISCEDVVNEHSPQVSPEVVNVSTNSVTVKWNSAGPKYYYNVIISIDSIADNSFQNPAKTLENIEDTICTIDSLLSNTWHKLVVLTMGDNKAPNQSWPPLRFKTE